MQLPKVLGILLLLTRDLSCHIGFYIIYIISLHQKHKQHKTIHLYHLNEAIAAFKTSRVPFLQSCQPNAGVRSPWLCQHLSKSAVVLGTVHPSPTMLGKSCYNWAVTPRCKNRCLLDSLSLHSITNIWCSTGILSSLNLSS